MVGGSSFLTTKQEGEDPLPSPPNKGRGANITGKLLVVVCFIRYYSQFREAER